MLKFDEIDQRVVAENEQALKQAEMYVDAELVKGWDMRRHACIGLPPTCTSFVANKLADLYRQNGWKVTVSGGAQCDPGFFLTFTAGPKTAPRARAAADAPVVIESSIGKFYAQTCGEIVISVGAGDTADIVAAGARAAFMALAGK